MKLLLFIENLRPGGKERRLIELVKNLKRWHDPEIHIVLTRKEIHYKEIHDMDVHIHYAERKGLKKDPRVFLKFFALVWRIRPDLIHVWGNMVAIYAIPAKVFFRIPMVNSQITDAPLQLSIGFLDQRFTFPFSNIIVANSKAGLKAYDAPMHKSKVIYNGFDSRRLKNLSDVNELKEKFKISTPLVVGMVASFSNLKDHKTFILAAKKVVSLRSDVTFICVGQGDDGPYREMLNEKEAEKILFLGQHSNVESIMNMCDIGVLTSNIKVHGEGISNALMEFSALAKPILATDNGGTPEILMDGKNGFLLQPFEHEDLAKKIVDLLNDPQKRKTFGETAKNQVESKFSIDKMVNSFYEVYTESIN